MSATSLRSLSLARRALKTALHHLDTAHAQAGLTKADRYNIAMEAEHVRVSIARVYMDMRDLDHTEFWNGKWHWPSNAEPQAIVSYASEPSPETGHIGWVWWALGKMGEAVSYEAAKTAAEDSLQKQAAQS